MFHPDNIKNYAEGKKISLSLDFLFSKFEGMEGLHKALKTNPKDGISSDPTEMDFRKRTYGENYKRPPKIRTLWELIIENFEDRIL